MNESIAILRARGMIEFQVMAAALAFATRDVENQDQLLEDVMRAIARDTERAIAATAVDLALPDALRNSIFAECMEHLANIKSSTLGAARAMRD